MANLTIHEFDHVFPDYLGAQGGNVPPGVFGWLEQKCHGDTKEQAQSWLRPSVYRGRRAVQVTSFVGVIEAPGGFQIEVLPKIGRGDQGGARTSRQQLIEMLKCLDGFRHVRMDRASVAAERMPLLEVFIQEFLLSVEHVVQRGMRNGYVAQVGNLHSLRGKLLFADHLKQNICRGDRFYAEFDVYSPDRPENRLICAALRRVLTICRSQDNQKRGRELCFVFSEVPASKQIGLDFQRVALDRGMVHYHDALFWAKLILGGLSPLVSSGANATPSLLFPMAAVFEAYVAKHVSKQLVNQSVLKTQVQGRHLVEHRDRPWFRLKPDLLIRKDGANGVVLDTKWKLLDARKADAASKYQLSQADFYQLYAYGQNYLDGDGDVVLIFPKFANFDRPLPVFNFPKSPNLRLWVVPFCLDTKRLILPEDGSLSEWLAA